MFARVFILVPLIASLSLPGVLCRYTVRDVAFVAFDGDRYTLDIIVPEGTPEKWADTVRRIARASLADTEVVLKIATKPIEGPPRTTLRSPDGRTLPIPLPADVEGLAKDGWDALDAIGQSPARDAYKAACLEAHAVIVVFEGASKDGNARARRLANEAIALATTLEELPKPAKKGPQVLVVPYARREAERVFHWSTGASDEEAEDAHVAVLYGRGRRMGPVMAGPVTTASDIKQALLLIGQDCECELPRTLMRGPMVPMSWTTEDADRAQKILGFDGRNPMVKQEIARIVAREASAPGAPRAVGIDPLGLGYSESEVVTGARGSELSTGDRDADIISPDATTPSEEAQGVASLMLWVVVAVVVVILILVRVVSSRAGERA